MRKWLVPAALITVMVAIPLVVIAGTRSGSTPVKCIASQWRTSPVSTSSTSWSRVPGLNANIAQVRPVIINASALLSGAPVAFRVRTVNIGGQHRTSRPGPTRFVPGGSGANSFAYQWIDRGNAAAVHQLVIRLQWRSTNGHMVTMLRGDMTEAYATDHCAGAP
jgi:hypothetical protein